MTERAMLPPVPDGADPLERRRAEARAARAEVLRRRDAQIDGEDTGAAGAERIGAALQRRRPQLTAPPVAPTAAPAAAPGAEAAAHARMRRIAAVACGAALFCAGCAVGVIAAVVVGSRNADDLAPVAEVAAVAEAPVGPTPGVIPAPPPATASAADPSSGAVGPFAAPVRPAAPNAEASPGSSAAPGDGASPSVAAPTPIRAPHPASAPRRAAATEDAPPLPTLIPPRPADAPPIEVVIHVPPSVAPAARGTLADLLRAASWPTGDPVVADVTVSATHLRYYHEADRAAAAALGALLDAPARDFTAYRPSPRAGLVELWMAGRASSAARASTRSAEARAARPVDPITALRRFLERLSAHP